MNAIVLPLVRKIDGPEEYPFSRAKIQVGEQWYITVGRDGPLLIPELFETNSDIIVGTVTKTVAYRCRQCWKLFMSFDHEGYIHKCCEVE